MNILVVDDDREIVDSIGIFLSGEGYKVLKAYDGIEALDILSENEVHLMILDIMMPKLDGIKTLMKLRESRNIPVILLSAKSEDADKILGLTAGADDYVTKPFNPSELVARVKSQLRRYTTLGSIGKQNGEIVIDGLVVNTEKKTVKVDGEDVRLTPIEYKILELLVRNRGRVFSAEDIYEYFKSISNDNLKLTDILVECADKDEPHKQLPLKLKEVRLYFDHHSGDLYLNFEEYATADCRTTLLDSSPLDIMDIVSVLSEYGDYDGFCESFAKALLDSMRTDDEKPERMGHYMLKAIKDNSFDDFLIAICGWSLESLMVTSKNS